VVKMEPNDIAKHIAYFSIFLAELTTAIGCESTNYLKDSIPGPTRQFKVARGKG